MEAPGSEARRGASSSSTRGGTMGVGMLELGVLSQGGAS